MIRKARPDDIGRLLELGRAFFDSAGWGRVVEWDPMSVIETIEQIDDTGVVLVLETDGRVTGGVGAAICPSFFNKTTRMSQELFWYVDPPARREGMALLSALEAGCKDKGASIHLMGAVAGDREEKFDRFYRARGYAPAERFFIKRLG